MTRLESWAKGAKWLEWQKVMELPIVQDALAVLEEGARPNAAANTALVRDANAPDAAFKLAYQAANQAGQQAAVDRLRRLAAPFDGKQKIEPPAEPFAHINEDNYEQFLQPR